MVMVYLCADAIKSQRYTTVRNKNFVVLEEFIGFHCKNLGRARLIR